MKNRIFTFILAFFVTTLFSQITVVSTDLINMGDTLYESSDTLPSALISVGNIGANQTWDFSSLQKHDSIVTIAMDPSSTPFGSIHPTANICIEDDGQFTYFEKSMSGINLTGFDNIPLNKLVLPLPLTYGQNISVPSTVLYDSSFSAAVLPPGAGDTIAGPGFTVDSLKFVVESSSEFNVDAWGTMILPDGSFDVLRLKFEDVTSTTYEAHCTNAAFGLSGWGFPVPSSIIAPEVEKNIIYQWWTNDPSIDFFLCSIDVDSLDNIVSGVDFVFTPTSAAPPAGIENNFLELISVYPIPSSDQLIIETGVSCLTELILLDVMGKLVVSDSFTSNTKIDLSKFSKGTYFLNLKNSKADISKKIIVK